MKTDVEWWEVWSDYCAHMGDNRKALARLVADVRRETRLADRDDPGGLDAALDEIDREHRNPPLGEYPIG